MTAGWSRPTCMSVPVAAWSEKLRQVGLPEYVIKLTDKEVVLRNYAGKTYRYSQPHEPILVG